jgi:hypothetical protein
MSIMAMMALGDELASFNTVVEKTVGARSAARGAAPRGSMQGIDGQALHSSKGRHIQCTRAVALQTWRARFRTKLPV